MYTYDTSLLLHIFLSIFQSVTRLRAKGIGTLCGRLFLGTAEKIPPSELIDTTGAGDAFIGAVIYGMCNHSIHMFFRCGLCLCIHTYVLYAWFVIFPVISPAFQDGFSQLICPKIIIILHSISSNKSHLPCQIFYLFRFNTTRLRVNYTRTTPYRQHQFDLVYSRTKIRARLS